MSHAEAFLSAPGTETYEPVERLQSSYNPLHTFSLPRGEEKHYKQQYGDMYFMRLAKLKPAVEQIAQEAWDDIEIAGEKAKRVERVLDVRQGELCWVVGTLYMDMPLKPNILEDISKDHWIAAPPPHHKYLGKDGSVTSVMLEDESGRVRLVGAALTTNLLVTGCIIAVLGTENANGELEVIDVKYPDLPRQPQRWERDDIARSRLSKPKAAADRKQKGNKIAIVSDLGITGTDSDSLMSLSLLTDFLLGYSDTTPSSSSGISRLIIAGNSLGPSVTETVAAEGDSKKTKKYGYDASAYNAAPTTHLDNFLSELLPSLPITLMPGENDPANVSLPQQAIHPVMFPNSRTYSLNPSTTIPTDDTDPDDIPEPNWFDTATNPFEADIEGYRVHGNSGQPVDDILRYVDFGGDVENAEDDGGKRLDVLEAMMRWRLAAPTAPDTLWCYPYQTDDPFVLTSCPHIFFVGSQPRFETRLIHGENGQSTRVIAVPRFRETGQVVVVDLEGERKVEVLKIGVYGA